MKSNAALIAEEWTVLSEIRKAEARIAEAFVLFAEEHGIKLWSQMRLTPLSDRELERTVMEFARRAG